MPQKTQLFSGLTQEEEQLFLSQPSVQEKLFRKNERIFHQGDTPHSLYILLSGNVAVDHIDQRGKRTLVNFFNQSGTVFGEVYLYLHKAVYEFGCIAQEDSKVLCIPKDLLLYRPNNLLCNKICNNMLSILSQKALFLNKKLLITGSTSLRQKVAKYLLENTPKEQLKLELSRKDLANFLGVTRPSLSRELMAMQQDGLLSIEKNTVSFSREHLKNLL